MLARIVGMSGRHQDHGLIFQWERGSNENMNWLIRQYLPKGTCFTDLTDKDCRQIEEALNSRPRKKLGFATPDEAYDEQCCA